MELDTTMRMILQVPIWAQRVIYIQGSCLKDGDLSRARMNEAEACFVLAARNYADKTAAVRKFIFCTSPFHPLPFDSRNPMYASRWTKQLSQIVKLSLFFSFSFYDTRMKKLVVAGFS